MRKFHIVKLLQSPALMLVLKRYHQSRRHGKVPPCQFCRQYRNHNLNYIIIGNSKTFFINKKTRQKRNSYPCSKQDVCALYPEFAKSSQLIGSWVIKNGYFSIQPVLKNSILHVLALNSDFQIQLFTIKVVKSEIGTLYMFSMRHLLVQFMNFLPGSSNVA